MLVCGYKGPCQDARHHADDHAGSVGLGLRAINKRRWSASVWIEAEEVYWSILGFGDGCHGHLDPIDLGSYQE